MSDISPRELGTDETTEAQVAQEQAPTPQTVNPDQPAQPVEEITTPREDQEASETDVVRDASQEREVGAMPNQVPSDAPADQSSLGGTGGITGTVDTGGPAV